MGKKYREEREKERESYVEKHQKQKVKYKHFEKDNGETVHMHAANVTLGFLFDSVKIGLNDKCFIFPDKRQFCSNDKYTLKFYINHQQVPSIHNYVFKANDRILISYGNE